MKKGVIITIILVVIAVVLAIVFINLFKERDTTEMSNKVVSVVQDGYLDDEKVDGEYETINKYLDNLLAVEEGLTSSYQNEIQNFKDAYLTYTIIAKFYSKQIVFTDYNDVYKENKSSIMDGFNSASDNASDMVNYINTNSNIVGDNVYWNLRTWDDVKGYALNIINQTNKAFNGLQKVYTGCVTSKLANNNFATLVLSTINSYLGHISDSFSEEISDINIANTMANAYLSGTYQNIMTYNYNDTLKAKVEDILNNEESLYYSQLIDGSICEE